jgi:hypothetical protein
MGKPVKKDPWDISYQPKSVEELQEEQKVLVDRVCGLIDSDVSESRSFPLATAKDVPSDQLLSPRSHPRQPRCYVITTGTRKS